MGFFSLLGVFLLFLCSLSMACDRCVHTSSAAYYSSASVLSALDFNGGYVGTANSSLFREGIGCGGCLQIRCKNPRLCSSRGVKVVLTDNNSNNETEVVDIEYPRLWTLNTRGNENLKWRFPPLFLCFIWYYRPDCLTCCDNEFCSEYL
ncbi:expansin-like A2 [Nymphaea colorata]|nr:expansin-like A2 [Nymphaea colorata]